LSLEIMNLFREINVGAPRAYIRGPFMMEGVSQGALAPRWLFLALGAAFATQQSRYLASVAAAVNVSSVQFLSIGVRVGLVAGGMAVGFVGGLVAGLRS
jgi:cell division protein FtsX